MNFKTIAIAADHAGFEYKNAIKEHLVSKGLSVIDFGADTYIKLDNYPDFIHPASRALSKGEVDGGIIIGGTGNGEAMTANRHKGVRCALCWNAHVADRARYHNDANMISMGSREISLEEALEIVDTFLETPFEGGRHIPRIEKIDQTD